MTAPTLPERITALLGDDWVHEVDDRDIPGEIPVLHSWVLLRSWTHGDAVIEAWAGQYNTDQWCVEACLTDGWGEWRAAGVGVDDAWLGRLLGLVALLDLPVAETTEHEPGAYVAGHEGCAPNWCSPYGCRTTAPAAPA